MTPIRSSPKEEETKEQNRSVRPGTAPLVPTLRNNIGRTTRLRLKVQFAVELGAETDPDSLATNTIWPNPAVHPHHRKAPADGWHWAVVGRRHWPPLGHSLLLATGMKIPRNTELAIYGVYIRSLPLDTTFLLGEAAIRYSNYTMTDKEPDRLKVHHSNQAALALAPPALQPNVQVQVSALVLFRQSRSRTGLKVLLAGSLASGIHTRAVIPIAENQRLRGEHYGSLCSWHTHTHSLPPPLPFSPSLSN